MTDIALPDDSIFALVVSANQQPFVASLNGLFRLDRDHWVRVLPRAAEQAIAVLSVHCLLSGRLLAAVEGAIGYSDSNGDEWSFARLARPEPIVTCFASSADGSLVVAGTEDDGVLRSLDGGETWHSSNFGLLDLSVSNLICFGDNALLANTSTGLFLSTNAGDSWEPAIPSVSA